MSGKLWSSVELMCCIIDGCDADGVPGRVLVVDLNVFREGLFMPANLIDGWFYEFSRAATNREIGKTIPRGVALLRIRRGEDVYTPLNSDAKSLAKDVQKGKADWEGAHDTGYYPHFHPAGNHAYGHIFYGEAGYRQERIGEVSCRRRC